MTSETLSKHFQIGTFVFDRNLEGLSNEESLLVPEPAGNTLNWVVGHIVRARNQAIGILGAEPLYDDEEFVGYGAGRPLDAPVIALDELRRRFDAVGAVLQSAIGHADNAALDRAAPFSPTGNPEETVGSLLQTIGFHEAYHLGQTGTLRRLLGKPGALLAPGEEGHSA